MGTELHPHNCAIAEVRHEGQIGHVKAAASTANDDAIQLIVDLMAQNGIRGDEVLRLYSERQPSPEWYAYFAKHWPNVAVTWSFGPDDDDATIAAEITAFRAKRDKTPEVQPMGRAHNQTLQRTGAADKRSWIQKLFGRGPGR